MPKSLSSSGFTMIELLITITVLAIVLAFAVPSFQTMVENNRVTSQANLLLSAVNLARTEAVKRGTLVSLQAEPAGFTAGYCVVTGAVGVSDDCADAKDDGVLIRTFGSPGSLTVSDGGLAGVSFDGRGFRAAPATGAVNITLQPSSCQAGATRQRQLNVSLAGRASLTQEACD